MPNYFKIGVAAPIKNPKFRWGEELNGTINTALNTTGNTTISVVDRAAAPGWNQVFREWDVLQIGPSTHDENPGAKEFITANVVSNAPGSITIKETAGNQFKYNSGDPVGGIGSNLSKFWLPYGTTTPISLAVNFDGIFSEFGSPVSRREFPGVSDPFRAKIESAVNNSGYYFVNPTDTGILKRTVYRIGFYYKVSWTSGTSGFWTIGLGDTASTVFLITPFRTKAAGDQNDWTLFISPEVTPDFTNPGSNGVSNDLPTHVFAIFNLVSVGGVTSTLQIDHLFACHAQGSDSYDTGLYEFEWFPDLGSVSWTDWLDRKEVRDGLNIERYFDPTGRMGKHSRHSFSCHFSHVPQTMWDTLQAFDYWQSQGYSLVFLTGEAGYGGQFPSVMTGRMKLTGYQRGLWDQRRASFTFNFIED